jgi:hypothetical protein
MNRIHKAFLGWLLIGLAAASVSAQEILEKEPGLFSTKELKANVGGGTPNRLVIRSAVRLSGEINIRADNVSTVSLVYTKQARTGSKSKGMDYIDLIAVTLDQGVDQNRLEMRAPNPAPWDKEDEAGIVTADLVVPRNCDVEIDAAGFDVTAVGPFRGLVVRPSLGKIDVRNVSGKLDVTTANQRVLLSDISGDISVTTTNAAIVANDITSTKEAARFRNEAGDMKITNFTGALNAKNSYGRIDLIRFEPRGEPSFVRGNSAPIIIELAGMKDGRLVVTNQYEDVELTVPDTIAASFALAVDEDGSIEALNLQFKTDLVEKDRLNLHTGSGAAEVSATIRGKGRVYLRGAKGE